MKIIDKTNRESGVKKSVINYYTGGTPRDKKGNILPKAVCLVAEAITFHRKKLIPIKTIYLCAGYWNVFETWARKNMLESEADAEIKEFTFDGVFIKPASKVSIEDIYFDYYPTNMAIS